MNKQIRELEGSPNQEARLSSMESSTPERCRFAMTRVDSEKGSARFTIIMLAAHMASTCPEWLASRFH
jgi:hypothetical protein